MDITLDQTMSWTTLDVVLIYVNRNKTIGSVVFSFVLLCPNVWLNKDHNKPEKVQTG